MHHSQEFITSLSILAKPLKWAFDNGDNQMPQRSHTLIPLNLNFHVPLRMDTNGDKLNSMSKKTKLAQNLQLGSFYLRGDSQPVNRLSTSEWTSLVLSKYSFKGRQDSLSLIFLLHSSMLSFVSSTPTDSWREGASHQWIEWPNLLQYHAPALAHKYEDLTSSNISPGFYFLPGSGDPVSKWDWPLFRTGI